MFFDDDKSLFFHNYERFQFSYELRRCRFIDNHHSKTRFEAQDSRYFEKNQKNQKVHYEKYIESSKESDKTCE